MDALRDGIGLRGYGQRDPKKEYQKEGFNPKEGRKVLASQRNTWKTFVSAMRLITGVDNA